MMSPVQDKVADFVAAHRLETTVQARILDLVSEVGELAKEALKGSDYGKSPFQPTGDWAGELADALFALICLANSTSVNLEVALDSALAKYEQRLADKADAGSGS